MAKEDRRTQWQSGLSNFKVQVGCIAKVGLRMQPLPKVASAEKTLKDEIGENVYLFSHDDSRILQGNSNHL
jgi:hypothetical protein